MLQPASRVSAHDPVWSRIRQEAAVLVAEEPLLASYVHAMVLKHSNLESALSYHLAHKLASAEVRAMLVREVCDEALSSDPDIGAATRADIVAVNERDPACTSYLEPLLYFKGFHALQAYRIAHWLWNQDRRHVALYLQNRISEAFGVDFHPAARIGRGIMIDHATGVVVGETAVIEDDVSMLHEVTLGGTGKESGDRHPKVRQGVLIGAGAKILGNVEIGRGSRVGAGSVVLRDVPAHCTVVGVPAEVVGCAGCDRPAERMDHRIEADE
ncbi:MAG: serine O-acetyltransferase [Candidatus Competibacterales bacterium]|nr:serine O-acetyltransferase [Candidatus Competibacterales bacterium]